jgi:hypothetical protein
LIPELGKAVLDNFKPARRLAQDEAVQKLVANRPARAGQSDRATLASLVEQFEHGPLQIHDAFALSALNDYDRRVQNEEGYFKAQRRVILAVCVFVLLVGVVLLAPLGFELSEWQLILQELLVFLGSISTVTLMILVLRFSTFRTESSIELWRLPSP